MSVVMSCAPNTKGSDAIDLKFVNNSSSDMAGAELVFGGKRVVFGSIPKGKYKMHLFFEGNITPKVTIKWSDGSGVRHEKMLDIEVYSRNQTKGGVLSFDVNDDEIKASFGDASDAKEFLQAFAN